MEKDGLGVEYISARHMKVPLNMNNKSTGISFVVASSPTDSHKSVLRQRPLLNRTRQHSCRGAERKASVRDDGRYRSLWQKEGRVRR